MAFSHPKPGKDEDRNGYKPNHRRVVWKLFKRTINVTNYRNAEDEVNPANNRAIGAIIHDRVSIFQR